MPEKPRPRGLCRYCDRDLYVSHIPIHETQCLLGPMSDKVKAYLHETAVDGQIISSSAYDREKPAGYPGRGGMIKAFDNWFGVAIWAGLEYTPRPQAVWRYDESYHHAEYVPDVEIIKESQALTEYPLLPGKASDKTIYNWRTRSYEPVTAYELR